MLGQTPASVGLTFQVFYEGPINRWSSLCVAEGVAESYSFVSLPEMSIGGGVVCHASVFPQILSHTQCELTWYEKSVNENSVLLCWAPSPQHTQTTAKGTKYKRDRSWQRAAATAEEPGTAPPLKA